MVDYHIISCLGHLNMAKAIEDMLSKDKGWKVHSFVAADVEEHIIGDALKIVAPPMDVQTMRVTRFVVLFERQISSRELKAV